MLFNLDTAYSLYSILLRPVERTLKDKKYLAVVPSGALTSLPFHLLVTDLPSLPASEIKDLGPYRDAAWLLRRQAVMLLPSVASLKALRSGARADHGAKPFIGFGDPLFGSAPSSNQRATTRASIDYWAGSWVDRGKLAEALPRLERHCDRDQEHRGKARRLKRRHPSRQGRKRDRGQARSARQLSCGLFRDHGLVAGDVKGVGEPALALTLPPTPTEADDGLLTASEVAQLKLNADWVVLSACNTMAGETPSAEALSGLARAFFAGTRALLVSHWTVASDSATRLAIATFDVMTKNPSTGRAEALRQAMLAYMSDRSEEHNANPAYRGSFSVVGQGEAR